MIAAILLLIGSAHAGNITACASGCDYDNIQKAIYGALPHDAIVLFSGTYNESVFLTKPLNFTGTDTGSGEPDLQGDLFTNGFEYALEGFSFSSVKVAPPVSDAAQGKMDATTWIGRGCALFNDGEFEQAAKASDEALKLDPGLAYAWFIKGRALHELGRYNESIQAYQAAVRIDSNYTSAWSSLGAVLFSQGMNDRAVDACDKAIELEANDDSAWSIKGYALRSLGKYDESVKCFDQALKIDEKNAYAWNGKGQSLDELKKFDDAVGAFDKAIELDLNYASAWNNKGVALDDQGKYDEAIKAYDEAIRLDPKYVDAWNNKGVALNDQGKYDEAIKAYDEAIRLNPKYAKAWNNKGSALYELGRYNEAIAAYDEALRLDSTYEIALKNREYAIKKRGLAGKTGSPAITPKGIAPTLTPAVNMLTAASTTDQEENTASDNDLLYADDFSSNLNWRDNWASQVNKNGKLRITINKRQYDSFRNPTIKAFKDCIIEAEATLEDDSPDNAFGLFFRQNGNNFYRFKISGKGEFGFDMLANRKWSELVPWTKSAAINAVKKSNLIRAQCQGNRFTFYVNGANLGEYIDDTFPNSGKVGLFADSASSAGTQVSFDNLKIWALTA